MRIQKLQIQNFQKHSKLELNFTDGVNIIHGATDAGKSCIVRAIKWVFFNEPKGDIVRKEGTKKTIVTVTLDTGEEISRIKSKSINAYHLIVDGEEKKFNSVGKTIPEEVQKVLRVTPISVDKDTTILNIADQIALPFLLDKSGGYRHKLFNKLSGAEISDKVLQDLNKDVLRVNRETKIEKEAIDTKMIELEALKEKEAQIKGKYETITALFEKISQNHDKYTELQKHRENIEKNKKRFSFVTNKQKAIKIPKIDVKNLKQKVEQYKTYKDFRDTLKTATVKLKIIVTRMSTVKIPKINISSVEKKIDKFVNLLNLKESIIGNKKIKEHLEKREKENSKKLEEWIIKYKEELKKRKICPTCKQSITEQTIKELKI